MPFLFRSFALKQAKDARRTPHSWVLEYCELFTDGQLRLALDIFSDPDDRVRQHQLSRAIRQ